ncbi:MAG: TFIIB-type zinc ribbon-containing protein [Planctomycetota bacterium]|jgi:Zn-finger nucleic acid-binding protein
MGDRRNRRELMCPKCQGRLHEDTLKSSGVRVDSCPSCRGMWFERDELAAHSAAVEGRLVPGTDASVSRRRCPVCGVPMTKFRYSGTEVEVDLCEECRGVWLDLGELKSIETGPAEEETGGFLGLLRGLFGE